MWSFIVVVFDVSRSSPLHPRYATEDTDDISPTDNQLKFIQDRMISEIQNGVFMYDEV